MHEEQYFNLLPLLIVTVLTFLVPLLLRRIRSVKIPIAVGEILAGMIVGRSGLQLVHADSTLQLLNFLGLVSLMFLSGLEINFDLLAGRSRKGGQQTLRDKLYNPLALGVLFLGLTLAGSWYFAGHLAARGFVKSVPLLAFIISTAALSMTVPVLKEANLMESKFGQTLLAGAVMGDFVTMVALTVGVSLYVGGFSLQTFLILGLLVAVLVAYRGARALSKYKLTEGLGDGTAQIGVRASFAAMLVFVALAQSLGVEAVLGAFLAGVLMSLLSGPARDEVSHKLDALGFGFLIPIFFVMVGVSFDFRVLLANPQALLFVPILLGVTILVRALPPTLLFLIFHRPRQALAGGALMTAQMSVTIAASAVVLRAGAISESIHAAIILVVILLAVLAPVAFGKLMPPQVVEQPPVLVVGANPLAVQMAARIGSTLPVTLIDEDREKVAAAREAGLKAVLGELTDPTTLQGAVGTLGAHAVVAMTGDDEQNMAVAGLARGLFGDPVYAVVREADGWNQARDQGLQVINPELATLALIENLVINPGAVTLLHADNEQIRLFDVVLSNPAFINRSLRQVRFPSGVLVAALHRSGDKLIPHGDTVLVAGDVLTVVGPRDQQEAVRRQLS